MPDCSYVEFHVSPRRRAHVELLRAAAQLNEFQDWQDGCAVDDDCPWGYTSERPQDIVRRLRIARVPFVAVDNGHYTWDPSMLVYDGGDGEPDEIECTQDGVPMLSESRAREIAASPDSVAALDRFYDAWSVIGGRNNEPTDDEPMDDGTLAGLVLARIADGHLDGDGWIDGRADSFWSEDFLSPFGVNVDESDDDTVAFADGSKLTRLDGAWRES